MGIFIKDTCSYLPEQKIENSYFENILDTSDEWIVKRTGIQSRYFSDISTAQMAVKCAKQLMNKHMDKSISLIVTASFSDLDRMPSISAKVANACKLFGKIRVFDINIACTGFVGAVDLAEKFLNIGEYALIIASEKISEFMDMSDRGTAILFGDGAGAILVQKTQHTLSCDFGVEKDDEYLGINSSGKIYMNGQEVFKFAITTLKASISKMLTMGDMPDYIVCHQANERILNNVANSLKIDENIFYKNLKGVGNTSAASIPICLDEMKQKKLFTQNKLILLCGFGAGLSYYSKYVEIECNDEF